MPDADRQWAADEDVAPVLEMIQRAAKNGARARPQANLELDLGLDSMERVELLTALEQRFGAKVPEDEAQRIFTVRELVEAIGRHRAAGASTEHVDAWATVLASDPEPSPFLTSVLTERRFTTMLLLLVLRIVWVSARICLRIDVTGREHLPPRGPCMISPNHQSYLDSFVVVGALPWHVARQLFFVGASEYFETRFMRWLARLLKVVPVDPDASLVSAMQAGAFGLRHGKVLVLFPEGERSIDGTVKSFKKGAAILSEHLNAPIVPVALDGLFDIWPRNRRVSWGALTPWRRVRVRVRFGAPIVPDTRAAIVASGQPPSTVERQYAATTAQLRKAVQSMWDDVHRQRLAEMKN
jgi:long-chain acyl-CoA synthetase